MRKFNNRDLKRESMAAFEGDKEADNVAEKLAGVTLEGSKSSDRDDLKKLDALYEEGKLEDLHAALLSAVKEKPEDFELLWRLARSHIDIADMKPKDAAHRENHFKEAEAVALKALELGEYLLARLDRFVVALVGSG